MALLAGLALLGCDSGGATREALTATRQALGSGTGLKAEYFDNQDLTAPKVTRTDATVNFAWGTGSPDPSIAADSFSVRWSGSVEPLYSETYTFSVSSDDGVRLWVNGVLLVDAWVNGTAERSGTITLAAGQKVPIQLEYYEASSSASAKLSWASASQPKEIIPSSQLYAPVAGTGTGLRVRYYDNQDLTNLKVSRTEGPINFAWGTGSPDPSIAADSFSSRWTGVIEPLYSETYTLYTLSDDGVRLWVDGVLLIDNWTTHTPVENRATVALTAGRRHAIQVDHYEVSSSATLKLSWSSPTQAKQIVPASQLYPEPIATDAPQLAGTLTAPASAPTGQALELSWTVTNHGTGTAKPSWYDTVYLSTDALPGGDTLLTGATTARTAALAPGESYSVTKALTLPRVTPGNYFLVFRTDLEDHLSETDETDNVTVVPLTVLGANLVPTAFTAPARASNGERVAMTWTVENSGTATAQGQWYSSYPSSYRWYDRVYISTDATWDAADVLVGEVVRTNAPLDVGTSYTVKTDLQLPKVYPEGPAFLILYADKSGDVVETDEANTFALPITVDRPDLVMDALTSPPEAAPGELVALSWTAHNAGTGTAHGQWYSSYPSSYRWYDRVYLSTDTTWDAADTLVGEVSRVNAPLAAGASYTTSVTMQLPAVTNGAWYLLAVVDKSGDVNEQSEDNNLVAVPIAVGRADLVADAFTGPAAAANGERVTLSWTARNAGTNTANGKWYSSYPSSYRWYDRVFLSTDATWDAADTLVGEVSRVNAPLTAGASYATTTTMQLPKVYPEGAAYLVLVLDKNGDVNEDREDNNTFAIPLTVLRPDLVADTFTAPGEAAAGELVSMSWAVRNGGTGTAQGQWYSSYPSSYRWYDRVYLSTDGVLDAADLFVGEVSRVNAPLDAGASYTVTTTMQLPASVADGPWSLLLVTDDRGDVNELGEGNNVFARPINVGRADLVVDAFTGPLSAANGERVAVSWTARNAGANTANGKWYSNYPSSYRWYDRVYISTDATWDAADVQVGEVVRANAPLAAGGTYTASTTVQLPKVYPEGAAYLVVVLDKNGDVSEQSETNNTFALPLDVLRSNLVAEALTAPSEVAAGEVASLAWTVRNAGTGRAHGQLYTSGTDSYRWYDKVYLSADGVLDAADVLVGEVARASAPLDAGASYTVTTTMQVPTTVASGSYRFLVAVDGNADVNEQSETDNVFAVPVAVGRADLVAGAFTGPASAANGEVVTLSWTAKNTGTNTANGRWYTSGTDSYRWYDRVYLSTDDVWDSGDTLVGEVMRASAPLAAGASYTVTTSMQLPKVYAEGAVRLLLVLDQGGDVSEQAEDNNTFALPLTVTRPDLVAESLTAPADAAPSELVPMSWTVRNVGTGTAHGQWNTSGTDSYRWYDRVYLSSDRVLDAADTLVGEVARNNAPVAPGGSYTTSVTLQMPTVASGPWYLLASVDHLAAVNEQSETNNVVAVPISIGRADLVVDAFVAPAQVASGELVPFSVTARNAGTNVANGRWYTSGTDSYRWYDRVYLSNDTVLDASDTLLGEVARVSAPLAASATYSFNATFQVPTSLAPGRYYFLAALDQAGDVSESDETNNVAQALAVDVTRADLVVDAFTGPAQAATGQPVALAWTVRNAGTGKANGRWYTAGSPDSYRWYDRAFLSTDTVLDDADLLVGEVARVNTPLASGATYSATATLAIPPAPAGSYYLLLETDANDDVNEDGEGNNVLAAPSPISISAPDLKPVALNGPDASLTQVPVTLSWTVTNVGAGAAVPTWNDDIYLTADESCCGDPNDVKVTSVTHTPDLAPGASYSVTVTAELPKVPSGPYHLVVRTRSGTSMYDADGTNDTLSIPIEIHATVEEAIVSLDGTGGSALKSPRFSPDGSRLVVADGPKARIFELATFTERGVYTEHTANLDTVAFSPTGDQVLSGARDGSARVWDSIAFAGTTTVSSSTGANPAAWSADGAWVVVGNGNVAKLFDSVTGGFLRSFTGHTSTVTAVALSPDGTLAATASADKTARLWNTATGALVRTLSGHTAQVNAVAFSPSGAELLTASNDGTLRFWDVQTFAEVGRINQGSKVGDASWSADGLYVVSADESSVSPGLGYLWERATLEGVRTFYHFHENDCVDPNVSCGAANRTPGKMTGIALSPDRTMVVGTQPNGKVRVWASGLTAIVPDTTVNLTPGVAAPLTLRPNRTYYFRVDAAAWDSLVMTMEGSATAGATFASNAGADPLAVQMMARYGTAPSVASRDALDQAHVSRIRAGIPIVNTREGAYYVSLSAPFLTSGAISGTLVVQSASFDVASVSPRRVGNAGRSTFAVKGTGLSDDTRVELVSASGAAVASTRVLDLDVDTLGVTFDLANAAPGTYAVRVTHPATGQTRTLANAVTVAPGTGGSLRTWIEGPTAVRGSTVRPLKVRWKNDGDADLAAPILVISSSDGKALLDANWVPMSAMQVIASGEGFPGDVLPPGAEGSFTFDHRFPNVSGNTTLQIGLASEDSGPFNWSDIKPLATPSEMVGDATWDAVWNDAVAALGTTRGQVAASFRRVNVHSTSPASIEAVIAWALYTEMSQNPLALQEPAGAPAPQLQGAARTGRALASASVNPLDVVLDIIQGGGAGGGINPNARTFVLSHGWNSNPSTFTDLAARIARDYPGANIIAVDWSKLSGTGVLHPVRAARNGAIAGARAAELLRALGITDNITHVTHSHGQFVAEGIAKHLGGTQRLLALDAANPMGHGFRWPDYSVFKGGAAQLVNPKSIADDWFPHNRVPRGFAPDKYMWGVKDLLGHNGAKRMATLGSHTIDDLFNAVTSGRLGSKLGFRGSVLFFAADILICGGNDWCSFGLALAESIIFWNPTPILLWGIFKVLSLSPEEIHGPAPHGETVSRAAPWNYEVVFWNSASAAGPVQELVVIEYLDPNLDWSSVDFHLVEYGGHTVDIPPDVTTTWSVRDMPGVNGCTLVGTAEGELAVDISLDYDPQQGRIEWRLKVVDTALEDFPWDPYAGILPPPDEKLCGRGHVTYTAQPRSDVSDGEPVSAKAAVIFDTNAANYTNTVTNYIGP